MRRILELLRRLWSGRRARTEPVTDVTAPFRPYSRQPDDPGLPVTDRED